MVAGGLTAWCQEPSRRLPHPDRGGHAPRRSPVRDHPADAPAEAGARRDLAEKLEVSERTIYRDVRDLMASRVPIEGEAGVGYALRQGFDLPPLMFDEHEIEALVLGARIIAILDRCQAGRGRRQRHRQGRGGDPGAPAPAHGDAALLAPAGHFAHPDHGRSERARLALRRRLKVHFCYRDALNAAERPHGAAARAVVLRSVLAARSVVRAARGLPLVSARSHLTARRAGRALPA